jgi:hypothetical protein
MTFAMRETEYLSLADMEQFLKGTRQVVLEGQAQEEINRFVQHTLQRNQYRKLSKQNKGIVRRFLCKITGLGRAQITRLITGWRKSGRVQAKACRRRRFPRKYSVEDIALLAEVDEAHEDLSGPAIRRILQREYEVFGKIEYETLSGISPAHIYNLRRSQQYRKHRVLQHRTQARKIAIGERRKPDPKGQPGYIRVDTVHQGDWDGSTGLYFINAVDTETQWQIVGCVSAISENHLIPVLEAILHQFPFRILGFHSDNGSEFINHRVARMLQKMHAEFTKSRSHKSADNAQVEGKNGSVIRKHIGYGPIDSQHAEAFQKFFTSHFNPYLNFHRPCGFATVELLKRGKKKRTYKAEDYRTPYEKLVSLPGWEQSLKPGLTVEFLHGQAQKMSDTEAAQRMQKAKQSLLANSRKSR